MRAETMQPSPRTHCALRRRRCASAASSERCCMTRRMACRLQPRNRTGKTRSQRRLEPRAASSDRVCECRQHHARRRERFAPTTSSSTCSARICRSNLLLAFESSQNEMFNVSAWKKLQQNTKNDHAKKKGRGDRGREGAGMRAGEGLGDIGCVHRNDAPRKLPRALLGLLPENLKQ